MGSMTATTCTEVAAAISASVLQGSAQSSHASLGSLSFPWSGSEPSHDFQRMRYFRIMQTLSPQGPGYVRVGHPDQSALRLSHCQGACDGCTQCRADTGWDRAVLPTGMVLPMVVTGETQHHRQQFHLRQKQGRGL